MPDPRITTLPSGTIEVRLEGDYPIEEMIRLIRETLALRPGEAPVNLLADARCVAAPRSNDEVRSLALGVASIGPSIGRVAILTDTDLKFGMARMASTIAELKGLQAGAFRSRGEAVAYLEADGPSQLSGTG